MANNGTNKTLPDVYWPLDREPTALMTAAGNEVIARYAAQQKDAPHDEIWRAMWDAGVSEDIGRRREARA
jgi:hypothetical protein